jgi:hypothetical protein
MPLQKAAHQKRVPAAVFIKWNKLKIIADAGAYALYGTDYFLRHGVFNVGILSYQNWEGVFFQVSGESYAARDYNAAVG